MTTKTMIMIAGGISAQPRQPRHQATVVSIIVARIGIAISASIQQPSVSPTRHLALSASSSSAISDLTRRILTIKNRTLSPQRQVAFQRLGDGLYADLRCKLHEPMLEEGGRLRALIRQALILRLEGAGGGCPLWAALGGERQGLAYIRHRPAFRTDRLGSRHPH